MSQNWILDNESKVFTIVKAKTMPKLKTKYPKIYYTTSDESVENPIFPTVYIHEMSGVEQGIDLERADVNAVLTTFEVQVSVDTTRADAKEVMKQIYMAFKDLKFDSVSTPITSTKANMFVSIARFRRLISDSDVL